MDDELLSRVEDAGLNASAPPQQLWLDGWLVRFSPGKARRARYINAVAAGRRPLAEKLDECARVYAGAALPMVVRITQFTQPPTLDDDLAALGWSQQDDTRVMVAQRLPSRVPALPDGLVWEAQDAAAFAESVGALRASPPAQRVAQAQRLAASPVPFLGFVIRSRDGTTLACGQMATEGGLVGLYDIVTTVEARRQGLATLMCERLLSKAASAGAETAYLQVEADNVAARSIYRRIGFVDGYGYRYREPSPAL